MKSDCKTDDCPPKGDYWDLTGLFAEDSSYEVLFEEDGITGILFENEPYKGRPTKVFAYLGVPDVTADKIPAMVLLHGGGGKAFKEWVALWNKLGYAAISMDFGGCGPDGARLADCGPEQDHVCKFDADLDWKDLWTYHSVAAIIRSHNIIRGIAEVDNSKVGMTGISWGGYLTCVTSGVDSRFACAIPVYGCGFLQDNSAVDWMNIFSKMSPEELKWWDDHCDPASYLPFSRMPMLFVTGTNDFAYPLDSLEKSCALCQGPVTRCVRHEMAHGHEVGWAPHEIAAFTDSIFSGKPSLPRISEIVASDGVAEATFSSDRPITRGYVLHTCDKGPWQERKWIKEPAEFVSNNSLSNPIPEGCVALFFAIENSAGMYVSTKLFLAKV